MQIRGGFWVAALVVSAIALIGLDAPIAEAQVSVATVPFRGTGADGARRQVQRALDDDPRVLAIDPSLADAAAGGGPASTAATLDASLIIEGRVTGRGRRRQLQLVGYDRDGHEIGRGSGALPRGVERAVRELLDTALPRVRAAAEPPREAPPPPVDLDTELPGPDDESEEEERRDSGSWETRAPLLDVAVGIVPRSREAEVTFQDSRSTRYRAWYTELAARLELRPFNADPSVLSGLYARAGFAQAVGLTSKIEGCTDDRCGVDTTYFRLDFAAGILFPLGSDFELGAEFGAGWDTYTLDVDRSTFAQILLESAEYVYLRPAVRARMRIVREYLVLGADVGVRPTLGRGNLSTYGESGDTTGFDVGGSLGGGIALGDGVGITYAFTVQYVNYWMNFAGASQLGLSGLSGTEGSLRFGVMVGLGIW